MPTVKRILIGAVAIIFTVLLVYLAFVAFVGVGPDRLVMGQRFQQKLHAKAMDAISKWEQHDVNEYEIDVIFSGWPTLWFQCVSLTEPVTLHVRDKVVVQAEGHDLDLCKEVYQLLTIDAMLEYTINEIESYDHLKSTLYVTFDPEWGYVSSYEARLHTPIWESSLGESVIQVQVHGFRPSR